MNEETFGKVCMQGYWFFMSSFLGHASHIVPPPSHHFPHPLSLPLSSQAMASRLYEKEPTKLAAWRTQQGRQHQRVRTISNSSTNSDDYPLQDDQDDPVASCGHDEDTGGLLGCRWVTWTKIGGLIECRKVGY